jgi:putative peptidoglycan lipid II flippase
MTASQGRLAARVGAGILVTRLLGFVRERVFAHYFGTGVEADAYGAALRIPNVIRNLLGEGTLSASFIPVYAGMLERGEHDDARRLAGTIVSLLILLAAGAALIGFTLAPFITDFAAPGFSGARRDLTVRLVRILFPMAGLLIVSAWCLGVLNTHRRFFLAYAAPAVWNVAQIATLVAFGASLAGVSLVIALAWGAVVGSALQIVVQLPSVLRLVRRIHWSVALDTPGARRVIRAWLPVVFGAGVVQISSIIDIQLASLLGSGAVATLRYAQILQILPISLFGISVAAAALPELSRDVAAAGSDALRERLGRGVRHMTFFVFPSAFAFAALGPLLIGALFQTGAFDASDTALAGGVLAAYSFAIPAQASIKLLASGHYALGDTRTPVRFAAVGVAVSALSAVALMPVLGVAGIAIGAALGATTNATLNLRALRRRVGAFVGPHNARAMLHAGAGACVAAVVTAAATRWLLHQMPIVLGAVAGAMVFAAFYGLVTLALNHPDARRLLQSLGVRFISRGE